jgi:DNA-binding MarR family transcriptional regulator
MRTAYLDIIALVERSHRQYLEVVKLELDAQGVHDINNVQAMILFNIGDLEMTVGELTLRGCYLGSNVSYNVKKLVEMGYLHHARSRIDRRSVRISLTEKGEEVHKIIVGLYEKHAMTVEQIGGVLADDFVRMNVSLARLERFWTDQIKYRL